MQGYCQISSFVLEEEPVDYIILSRRSRDRAGLRYQRRGIDDEAHVANYVETETIVRVKVGINYYFGQVTDTNILERGKNKHI